MTEAEITAQIKNIVDTLQVREIGLYQKYGRLLNNRKVGDNTILGVSKYTEDGNVVYMVCSKQLYGRSARRAELVFTYYISCLNPYDGKLSFIRPNWDMAGMKIIGFTVFTNHCIKRLKERAGEEFIDFLRKYGANVLSWQQIEGEESVEGKMFMCPHKFFGYRYGDSNIYITTMVTEDMCFDNQIETAKELEDFTLEYMDRKNRICQ